MPVADVHDPLVRAMVSCHSLALIEVSVNAKPDHLAVQSEIIGDPLDVIMFQFSQWVNSETTFTKYNVH